MHTPKQCAKHTPQCVSTSLLGGLGAYPLKIRCSEMQSGSILCRYPVVFTFISCIYFLLAMYCIRTYVQQLVYVLDHVSC